MLYVMTSRFSSTKDERECWLDEPTLRRRTKDKDVARPRVRLGRFV
jgi:hypothetical protein